MKFITKTIVAALSVALLSGCKLELKPKYLTGTNTLKIASFNVSLDRLWFGELIDEMQISSPRQQVLVDAYALDKNIMSDLNKATAEKIIQIRNIAAIIQTVRPEILLLNNINNDGNGTDSRALDGFQKNYLQFSQSQNSIDGSNLLKPITYPYQKSFSTNSGENSGLDLDNNGKLGEMPGDAWGEGNFYGQRSFSLLSIYEIDNNKTRTFQDFKWKDLPGAQNPTIIDCNNPNMSIPINMKCGDNWYSASEWNRVRLSSQNHLDISIKIPTTLGAKTLNLLISGPVAPIELDSLTNKNKMRNRDEIAFWNAYLNNKNYIYDDSGRTGGLEKNTNFVILGTLNADPYNGNAYKTSINSLLNHQRVNGNATVGNAIPTSFGAPDEYPKRNYPERLTSADGLRIDYLIPSSRIQVEGSEVYWPAKGEKGNLLINDSRIGNSGTGKDVSSDHRMVWSSLRI